MIRSFDRVDEGGMAAWKNSETNFRKPIDKYREIGYNVQRVCGLGMSQLQPISGVCEGREKEMAEVRVKEGESLDSALRRFKRQCARSNILTDLRKREYYEKPSVKRKKKSEAARKRKYK